MKFYELNYSTKAPKPFPVASIDESHDYGNYLKMHRYFGLYYDEFAPLETHLHILARKRSAKSKLTDIISSWIISGYGFLISKKLKTLLSKFNLCRHEYYGVTLKLENDGSIRDDYFWLHLGTSEIYEQVDYKKSKFYTTDASIREEDIELTCFQDYKDFVNSKEPGWGIFAEEIHFKEGYELPFDVFVFHYFSMKVYITEALKLEIEKQGITGVEIEEVDNIFMHAQS